MSKLQTKSTVREAGQKRGLDLLGTVRKGCVCVKKSGGRGREKKIGWVWNLVRRETAGPFVSRNKDLLKRKASETKYGKGPNKNGGVLRIKGQMIQQ